MKPLRKIAFLIDEFALQSPAQQLLDRFLLGYPRDGEFHRIENCQFVVSLAGENAELERRQNDFGLMRESDAARAIAGSDAAVVVPAGAGGSANEPLVRTAIENLGEGSACFVHGALAQSLTAAQAMAQRARERKIQLLAGTPLPVTWRLPDVDLELGETLKDALVVVQGASPNAELHALESLMPVIGRRRNGEAGVRSIRAFRDQEVWRAGESGQWSWPLLAAALSRSDTPQGNAVKDGRTEDLVGLGLVSRLAKAPRAWLVEHGDGLRSCLMALDGVVADFNFAVETRDETVVSAQIYRPPAPSDHQYSRLAEVLEGFFRSSKPPWPVERNILIAGLVEEFQKAPSNSAAPIQTPNLARLGYQTSA